MKNILIAVAVLSASFAFADGDAPAETPAYPVSVSVDDATTAYNLAVVADADDVKGAKSYIDAYADNVQNDKQFKANEAKALETIRTENRFFGTWWAIFPPLLAIFLALITKEVLLAIFLALITKEVYSSLFIGIVSGGLLYSGFSLEGTMTHVVKDGFIGSIADGYNIGILFFLVLLGSLVAMMNKTGASAAFGRWAQTHIKSRIGAQVATIILGMLIFVDDYFNCLTVGSVMRPVTDAKRVSRAKLAYLIDATAAPICIIQLLRDPHDRRHVRARVHEVRLRPDEAPRGGHLRRRAGPRRDRGRHRGARKERTRTRHRPRHPGACPHRVLHGRHDLLGRILRRRQLGRLREGVLRLRRVRRPRSARSPQSSSRWRSTSAAASSRSATAWTRSPRASRRWSPRS